jgi:serpin B
LRREALDPEITMRNFLGSFGSTLLLATLPTLAAIGCSHDADLGTPVSTTVQRDLSPQVAAGDQEELVAGNSAFAFDLFHGLAGQAPAGNLFYSPYSVSLALAMTYAGAAGATATEMASALHFTLPSARLHPAFDQLDLAIQKKPAGATGADGQPFAIDVADALWGDQRVGFRQGFVDTLAADYGASLRAVDFAGHPAEAEAAINNWVAAQTNDRIDPLLGPGAVTPDTRFVIVNAVYFNASWQSQFDKSSTRPGTFTRADGSSVQASMMSSSEAATAYAKGSNWQAVELPYAGGTTSMVVVLPDAGALSAVEQGLSGDFYAGVTAALSSSTPVTITMPSFTIHGPTVSLVAQLQALGMKAAFDPGAADFTPMIPAGGTFIGDVLHQAFVSVDETGTEAAAATAVIGVGRGIVSPVVTVTADHPFFFFIRDRATGTILFAGREGDPTSA